MLLGVQVNGIAFKVSGSSQSYVTWCLNLDLNDRECGMSSLLNQWRLFLVHIVLLGTDCSGFWCVFTVICSIVVCLHGGAEITHGVSGGDFPTVQCLLGFYTKCYLCCLLVEVTLPGFWLWTVVIVMDFLTLRDCGSQADVIQYFVSPFFDWINGL